MIPFFVLFFSIFPVFAPAEEQIVPYNYPVPYSLTLAMGKEGFRFLSRQLELGLEQTGMRKEVVTALEDQVFLVLVPVLGGYARVIVDYGVTSNFPEKDGFRYDNVGVTVSTVPPYNLFPAESGVLYPTLTLLSYSQGSSPEKLAELHVRIEYPLLPAPVSAIAYGKVESYGILRVSFEGGVLTGWIERFVTRILDFTVGFPNGDTGVVIDFLGEALLNNFRPELETALNVVLRDGINTVLFDPNKDLVPDPVLNLPSLLKTFNETFGTDLEISLESRFLTSVTYPERAVFTVQASAFQKSPGGCMGPDGERGFLYTLYDRDFAFGHDPPPFLFGPSPGRESQLTILVSDDFLNEILYNGYRTGLSCQWIEPKDPRLPPSLRSLMTVQNLSLLGLPFLTDYVDGDAPFGIAFSLGSSPYVRLGEEGSHMVVSFPHFSGEFYAFQDGRWIRLFGLEGSIKLGVSFSSPTREGELFQISFKTEVTTTVTFAGLFPGEKEAISNLLPTASTLLTEIVNGPMKDLQSSLSNCLPGLTVTGFTVLPVSQDPEKGYAHYLGLFLDFSGELDLARFLNECLTLLKR